MRGATNRRRSADVIEQLARPLDAWRRRRWRADPARLAAFAALQPAVLITGGSEGVGLAIARRYANAGSSLILIARDAEKLAAAADKLGPQARVILIAKDLTDPDALNVIDVCLARERHFVDVLINAAGVGIAGPFSEQSAADLTRLVDLNVRALTMLTRHYLPDMLARGHGGILNVASLGAYTPGPEQAAYYASKAYVVSLTEAIAAELAGRGVRISALLPGPVATAFHRRMGSDSALYLTLLPVQTAESVARSAFWRFRLGQRVIIPGLFNPLMAVAMRLIPHRLLLPIIGFLLRPRGRLGE